jgi:hypothetical protein
MLRDQTIAEVSASGGAYRDARQIEPAFASATGPWPPATR